MRTSSCKLPQGFIHHPGFRPAFLEQSRTLLMRTGVSAAQHLPNPAVWLPGAQMGSAPLDSPEYRRWGPTRPSCHSSESSWSGSKVLALGAPRPGGSISIQQAVSRSVRNVILQSQSLYLTEDAEASLYSEKQSWEEAVTSGLSASPVIMNP